MSMFDYSLEVDRVLQIRTASRSLAQAQDLIFDETGEYLKNASSNEEFLLRASQIDPLITRTAATYLPGVSKAKTKLVEALRIQCLGSDEDGVGTSGEYVETTGDRTLPYSDTDESIPGEDIPEFSDDNIDAEVAKDPPASFYSSARVTPARITYPLEQDPFISHLAFKVYAGYDEYSGVDDDFEGDDLDDPDTAPTEGSPDAEVHLDLDEVEGPRDE